MTNKTKKNKLEEKTTITPIQKRIAAIYEISARNELSFLEVLPIYLLMNYKVYRKEKKDSGNCIPVLEERIFRLTERIIDNYKIKKVNKHEKLNELKEYSKN